jgi:hypothetical protein
MATVGVVGEPVARLLALIPPAIAVVVLVLYFLSCRPR